MEKGIPEAAMSYYSLDLFTVNTSLIPRIIAVIFSTEITY